MESPIVQLRKGRRKALGNKRRMKATHRGQLGGCHRQQRKAARPERDDQDYQAKERHSSHKAHVLVGTEDSRGATATSGGPVEQTKKEEKKNENRSHVEQCHRLGIFLRIRGLQRKGLIPYLRTEALSKDGRRTRQVLTVITEMGITHSR